MCQKKGQKTSTLQTERLLIGFARLGAIALAGVICCGESFQDLETLSFIYEQDSFGYNELISDVIVSFASIYKEIS